MDGVAEVCERDELEAFAERFPDLHARLAALDDGQLALKKLDGGGIDVTLFDRDFYGIDAQAFVDLQLAGFFKTPHLMAFNDLFARRNFSGNAFTAAADRMVRDAIEQAGATVTDYMQRAESSCLVVIGLGLGLHLERLIDETKPRNVILIEPEPRFFKLAAQVIDWQKILDKVPGDRLQIIVEHDAEQAIRQVRSFLHRRNIGTLEGLYFFKHYASPYTDAIDRRLGESVSVFVDGLGFYDDEKVMLRNAFLNFRRGRARMVTVQRAATAEAPAFVIGAGPSLDKDIAFLKDNADRAVIFSGGSSLPALLHHGIVPDVHVEIENVQMNIELLGPLHERYDLSRTVLVASSSMDPHAARMFNKVIWFMREAVASSQLLDPGGLTGMHWQNPTVVNSALSAALSLGFSSVYMFGTDFGTRVLAQHHAAKTFYDDHDELRKVEFAFPITVRGNFGGRVHSSQHYVNGVTNVELLLGLFAGRRVYNCSDGAMIEGATAKRSKTIQLPAPLRDKHTVLADCIERLPVFEFESVYFAEGDDWVGQGMADFLTECEARLERCLEEEEDFIGLLQGIYRALCEIPAPLIRFLPMIAGSVNTTSIMMMHGWKRISESEAPRYEERCRMVWKAFFALLKEDFAVFIQDLRREAELLSPMQA